MKPTRASVLLAVGALSIAVGWAAIRLWESRESSTFMVPWSAPGAIAFLAVVLFGIALTLRARLAAFREGRPGAHRPDPIFAARAAALGKASSLVGALVAGLYLGVGIFLLVDYENSAVERRRLIACGVTVAAALVLLAAALFLEHVLKVPPDQLEEHESAEHGEV
ncbi:MAG TPA: DUF3180 domain-containing protein [Actinomycetes bacterium]|nr:DUF3180 domain-containing protein [Actinomycetes bacterium]